MQFKVNFKGINHFTGALHVAIQYVETQWGSVTHAYEQGDKLVPVIRH